MSSELDAVLAPGETLLWQGRPRPYVFILRGLPNIAYGVTWSVLGAFWYYGAGGVGKYSAFDGWWRIVPLLSLPFIFAGFSFWRYPIRLGRQARHTRYVVTNQRIFIAEILPDHDPLLRTFNPEEMAPPRIVKRFDGLYDVLLTRRAQDTPYLTPRLDSGFLGLDKDETAVAAVINSMAIEVKA